jgi:hypothetical protein
MVSALFMELKTGDPHWGPVIGLGGGIVILATLWLTIPMWPRLRAS